MTHILKRGMNPGPPAAQLSPIRIYDIQYPQIRRAGLEDLTESLRKMVPTKILSRAPAKVV